MGNGKFRYVRPPLSIPFNIGGGGDGYNGSDIISEIPQWIHWKRRVANVLQGMLKFPLALAQFHKFLNMNRDKKKESMKRTYYTELTTFQQAKSNSLTNINIKNHWNSFKSQTCYPYDGDRCLCHPVHPEGEGGDAGEGGGVELGAVGQERVVDAAGEGVHLGGGPGKGREKSPKLNTKLLAFLGVAEDLKFCTL